MEGFLRVPNYPQLLPKCEQKGLNGDMALNMTGIGLPYALNHWLYVHPAVDLAKFMVCK